MPVPSLISELSQTPGTNFPGGGESPIVIDDYFRAYAAFIATLRDGKGLTNSVSLASAATTDIGAQNSAFVEISGATAITSFGTSYNGPRFLRFTGALTLTQSAALNLQGGVSIATAAGDTAIAYPNQGATGWNVASFQRADGTALTVAPVVIPRGQLFGLTLSTAGASATVSVAAGQCADNGNVALLNVAATSKTTAAWAVGAGNGGLDAGTIAINTWYRFYAIRRPDTSVVDVIFSLSATSPTLPTNYTQYRQLGSCKTDGSSQWTKFVQNGDNFAWDVLAADVNGNATTTATSQAVTVPTGVIVEAILTLGSNATAFMTLRVSNLATSDQVPTQANSQLVANSVYTQQAEISVFTNTSAQVRSRATSANNYLLSTSGWIDRRGRDA